MGLDVVRKKRTCGSSMSCLSIVWRIHIQRSQTELKGGGGNPTWLLVEREHKRQWQRGELILWLRQGMEAYHNLSQKWAHPPVQRLGKAVVACGLCQVLE